MRSSLKTKLIAIGVCLVSVFLGSGNPLCGHETRSAYLEIKETSEETYDVFWRVPARGNLRLGIYVKLPEESRSITSTTGGIVGGVSLERWSIHCPEGLANREVEISGLSATVIDVLVRVVRLDGRVQTVRLSPDQIRFTVEASPSWIQVTISYLRIGVEHILLGVDHLLFVLGLLLIVEGRWALIKTISAFTVAHSLTLIIATLGIVSVPAPPLNAAIALSILFLGPEIVRVWRGQSSLTIRHPWIVAFFFGLLHGFGFASGLSDLGIAGTELLYGLLMFNIGVEIGQIGFVLIVLALLDSLNTLEFRWPGWAQFVPGYVVGTLGAFWTIERVSMLLGMGS